MSSNIIPTVTKNLHVPEITWFVNVLRAGLMLDFEEVTVQWVDCPDLTQPPYRLAAQGLCGNAAIMQVGSFSNLYPFPKEDKKYKLKSLLKQIDRKCDTFLIGSTTCFSQIMKRKKALCTVAMNALFLLDDGTMKVKNDSRAAFVNVNMVQDKTFFLYGYQTKIQNHTNPLYQNTLDPSWECQYTYSSDTLSDPEPECNMHGNFFISEGKPARVIKVHVKKHKKSHSFIKSLLLVLDEFLKAFETEIIVGMGGVFVVSNANVPTQVLPSFSNTPLDTTDSISGNLHSYPKCNKRPLVAVGAFVSGSSNFDFCTFNENEACGYFNHNFDYEQNETEYLGYFSLAEKLYMVDASPDLPLPPGTNSNVPSTQKAVYNEK